MPSGAKKRKAARKKKAHHHHHSHDHGDTRHHEDKDSDGGEAEALSPASLSHSDPFLDDGTEELEDPPLAGALASESKSSEVDPTDLVGPPKDGFEEFENVQIVKEVKSEVSSESKSANMECLQVEAVEISANGAVEMSANGAEEKAVSVGLDNGSQVTEKKLEQEGVEAMVLEASQTSDLIKQINSLPEEPAQIFESSLAVDSVESVSSVSEKVIHVIENLVVEVPVGSRSALKDQDEKLMPLINEASQVSETVLEVSSKKINETATVMTDEIVGKSSSDEKGRKMPLSPEVSIARASDVVEIAKESEGPKPSENQPPAAPLAKVVQKTSWFSCCGIFDVITGS